jgi:hypothetical protein
VEATSDCGLSLYDELFRVPESCSPTADPESGESLILDARGDLSPAQMVENKLLFMLRDKAMPVSQMPLPNMLRTR